MQKPLSVNLNRQFKIIIKLHTICREFKTEKGKRNFVSSSLFLIATPNFSGPNKVFKM